MNIVAKGILALSIFSLAASTAEAQIYVRIRPPRPKIVVTRPAPPSPRHVWVDEDWEPAGREYRWHGGYWAEPPRPRARWVPGHWSGARRGYSWIPGHWR